MHLRTPPLLNNKVLHIQNEPTRERVALACERTKEYLIRCGYDVQVV